MTLLKRALDHVGQLSETSKLPCYSWSIDAIHCKIGAVLAMNKIMSCHYCYALTGAFRFPCVMKAMQRRKDRLDLALSDPTHFKEFAEAFAYILNYRLAKQNARKKIGRRDARYFRWFDSGDLQGQKHLELIIEVARRTPWVKHWLPTKEYGLIRRLCVHKDGVPINLQIKLSSPEINKSASPGYLDTAYKGGGRISITGVHTEKGKPAPHFHECEAYKNNDMCGDCRACWSPTHISYPIHTPKKVRL